MSNKCYNKLCALHFPDTYIDSIKKIVKNQCSMAKYCEHHKAFNRILKSQYPKDKILPDAIAINKVGTKFLKEYGYKFGKPHPPIIELEKTNGDMEF